MLIRNTDITMYPIRELRKTDISFFKSAYISLIKNYELKIKNSGVSDKYIIFVFLILSLILACKGKKLVISSQSSLRIRNL